MDRNTRTLKMGTKTIKFYDYYMTNACVVRFVDADLTAIKNFFGNEVHEGLQELDKDNKVIAEEAFYLQKKNIFIENTVVIETEIKVIKEAYDETIVDEITREETVVHHEAETETIYHEIPVEMTTVTLEQPEIQDEVKIMKTDIKELKEIASSPATLDEQTTTLLGYMTANLTDAQALTVLSYIPRWEIGMDIKEGDRVSVQNSKSELELYKANKAHTTQENWKPSQATASLWSRIEPDHAGTKEDPIPYHVNMIVYQNKYYIEDGIKYLCTRDSGIALQNKASELVGHYFKKI